LKPGDRVSAEVPVKVAGPLHRFAFGPHYFVQVDVRGGKSTLCVGATHHGISADASEVGGELEAFVEELKRSHPDNAF